MGLGSLVEFVPVMENDCHCNVCCDSLLGFYSENFKKKNSCFYNFTENCITKVNVGVL